LGNVKIGLGDINVVFGLEIYNVLKQPILFGWGMLGFRVWRMEEPKGVKAMTHSMTTIRT
jgi:hypothetical protein